MKKIWARIGTTFELSDSDYIELKIAINNNDRDTVDKILYNSTHYLDGDSYLPPECDDNPNNDDFYF